jgi:hypothetical protein
MMSRTPDNGQQHTERASGEIGNNRPEIGNGFPLSPSFPATGGQAMTGPTPAEESPLAHDIDDTMGDLLAAAFDALDVVVSLVHGEVPIPSDWSMPDRLAVERFAQAAAVLLDRRGAFPIYEEAVPVVFYLPAPDDGVPRCGALTTRSGYPCRAAVLYDGDRCDHHRDAE